MEKINKKIYIKGFILSSIFSFLLLHIYFSSTIFALIGSIFLTKIIFEEYIEKKKYKLNKEENYNILNLISSLINSTKAGMNPEKSFIIAERDLDISDDLLLKKSIRSLVYRLDNNYNLKDCLKLFREEVDNQYIDLLVDSYISSYINGGNLVELIEEVEKEIRSEMNYEEIIRQESEASFNQLILMATLPVLVELSLRSMGRIYTELNVINIIIKFIGLFISILSFKWGKKIIGLDI